MIYLAIIFAVAVIVVWAVARFVRHREEEGPHGTSSRPHPGTGGAAPKPRHPTE